MKVHLFESEPWVQTVWHQTGTQLESVWAEGLITPESLMGCENAEIISSDVSVLNEVVLEPLKQLKLIAVRSTGVDHIDLAYCRSRSIIVCNVPAYARNAVAEHVFALLLPTGSATCRWTRLCIGRT